MARIPVNLAITQWTNWGSLEKRGESDPKFGALTITLECSGRVAKTEETRVVTLVTRGVTEFHPRLNLPASHLCDVIKFREFIY